MRITIPQNTALTGQTHPLVFTAQAGEQFRISILESDIVRVQYLPDGAPRLTRTWLVCGDGKDTPLEGRPRDDYSPFTLPRFEMSENADEVQISTDTLALTLHPRDFRLQWADAAGHEFASDLRTQAYRHDARSPKVWHYLTRREGENYYGFGEVAGTLDKAGYRMRFSCRDAVGYNAEVSDPLYKHWTFYITLVPELNIAYGLLYDNLSETVFDMGKEVNGLYGTHRYYHAESGDVDYYMIYGPGIADVLEKFAKLTGYPVLPPRYALGYLGSTMSYTEAANAQEQLAQFVALCTEHHIPCDLFHLSSGYTTGKDGLRYVFNWNHDRVPDPHTMTQTFHDAGIRISANIKPHLLTTHPRYEEVKAGGLFIRDSEDPTAPSLSPAWAGGMEEQAYAAFLDFTNPAAFNWWKARCKDALLEYGIDALWNDNNEFEFNDTDAGCNGFGEPFPVGEARPLHTLLMARASYEAVKEYHNGNERPYIISRSGCIGIQRYAQTWSGDNAASWHTLKYNTPMGLGLSLSGLPSTGHDIGGFVGGRPSPELFVRWVQKGVFEPRFTIHSLALDGKVNEPWMYPEVLPIVRSYINLRYRLIPYLYSLFYEASQTGHPIIRPLVYHFAQDEHCRTESFDFMLGGNLLVAPIYEAGLEFREVYLPKARNWYDFYTGRWYAGGQHLLTDAPLWKIPLFVTEGGLIPMGKRTQNSDEREVLAFPHEINGEGHFTLIEDDGISTGYQHGEVTGVRLSIFSQQHGITFRATASGGYDLPYSEITFTLPEGETRSVQGDNVVRETISERGQRRITVQIG